MSRIKKRFDVREIKSSKDITDWNAGKIPVEVIHPASAGHGLKLQAGGSTLIWFGLTWSLELYQQTNARLWRQGQASGTVVIEHIITKESTNQPQSFSWIHERRGRQPHHRSRTGRNRKAHLSRIFRRSQYGQDCCRPRA